MVLSLPLPPEELTKSEQRILEYINTNTEAFLFQSIGQLAERLDISEATVSRFARHAGFRDFKALKSDVLKQASGPAAKMAGTFHRDEDLSVGAWFHKQMNYLQTTAEHIDEAEFDRAVESVCSARRVFVYGKNASSSLAQMLFFRLRRIGIDARLLPSSTSEMLEELNQATADDVVAFFAFSKLSSEGSILLEHSAHAGYKTISFVSRTFIPPEERADIVLYACRGEEREYHPMSAPVALIDALTVSATQKLGTRSAEALSSLYSLKKRFYGAK